MIFEEHFLLINHLIKDVMLRILLLYEMYVDHSLCDMSLPYIFCCCELSHALIYLKAFILVALYYICFDSRVPIGGHYG